MLSNALSETNAALRSSLHLTNRQIAAARRDLVKQQEEANGLVAFGIFAKGSSPETTNIADAAFILLPTASVSLGEERAVSTQWKFANVIRELSHSAKWQQNLEILKHATDWSDRQAAAETAYTLFADVAPRHVDPSDNAETGELIDAFSSFLFSLSPAAHHTHARQLMQAPGEDGKPVVPVDSQSLAEQRAAIEMMEACLAIQQKNIPDLDTISDWQGDKNSQDFDARFAQFVQTCVTRMQPRANATIAVQPEQLEEADSSDTLDDEQDEQEKARWSTSYQCSVNMSQSLTMRTSRGSECESWLSFFASSNATTGGCTEEFRQEAAAAYSQAVSELEEHLASCEHTLDAPAELMVLSRNLVAQIDSETPAMQHNVVADSLEAELEASTSEAILRWSQASNMQHELKQTRELLSDATARVNTSMARLEGSAVEAEWVCTSNNQTKATIVLTQPGECSTTVNLAAHAGELSDDCQQEFDAFTMRSYGAALTQQADSLQKCTVLDPAAPDIQTAAARIARSATEVNDSPAQRSVSKLLNRGSQVLEAVSGVSGVQVTNQAGFAQLDQARLEQVKTGCWVTSFQCPAYGKQYEGTFEDKDGAGSEALCLARARAVHEACGSTREFTTAALYADTGASIIYNPAKEGCWVTQSVCAATSNSNLTGTWHDNGWALSSEQNGTINVENNEAHCLSRAAEWHTVCRNPENATTKVEFAPTGNSTVWDPRYMGCWIVNPICKNEEGIMGEYILSDAVGSNLFTGESICMAQAQREHVDCENRPDVTTTAVFAPTNATRSFCPMRQGCFVLRQSECRLHENFTGNFEDTGNDTAFSEQLCLARAQHLWDWCGNPRETPSTVQFGPTRTKRTFDGSTEGCWIDQQFCKAPPKLAGALRHHEYNGQFLDTDTAAQVDQTACLARAERWHQLCENSENMTTSAEFAPTKARATFDPQQRGCYLKQEQCIATGGKSLTGEWRDIEGENLVDAGVDPAACLARAKAVHQQCGNPPTVATTAVFRPSGAQLHYDPKQTGCWYTQQHCFATKDESNTGTWQYNKDGALWRSYPGNSEAAPATCSGKDAHINKGAYMPQYQRRANSAVAIKPADCKRLCGAESEQCGGFIWSAETGACFFLSPENEAEEGTSHYLS